MYYTIPGLWLWNQGYGEQTVGLGCSWILVSLAGHGANLLTDTEGLLYIFLTGVGKNDFLEFGDTSLLQSLRQVFLLREHFLWQTAQFLCETSLPGLEMFTTEIIVPERNNLSSMS